MQRLRFNYCLLVILAILIVLGGCSRTDDFTIEGLWEVNHTRYYPNYFDTMVARYDFKGNSIEGSVMRVPPTGGSYHGSYEVGGNFITFRHAHGRSGIAFTYYYDGYLYPELARMIGTVDCVMSDSGEETLLWSGPFVAQKIAALD